MGARTGGVYVARFCDQLEFAFGWVIDEFLLRCSHALVADGRVWLVDPLDADGVEDRVRSAGEPAGVLQLLDRHQRDCRVFAERLGVPHHEVPQGAVNGVPFEFLRIKSSRFWREVALWWPERRVLVCADAIGTLSAYRAGDEPLAVHPLLRLAPPRCQLAEIAPLHVLCGHGEGVHGDDAAPALREALATARRRLPRAWLQGIRSLGRASARSASR